MNGSSMMTALAAMLLMAPTVQASVSDGAQVEAPSQDDNRVAQASRSRSRTSTRVTVSPPRPTAPRSSVRANGNVRVHIDVKPAAPRARTAPPPARSTYAPPPPTTAPAPTKSGYVPPPPTAVPAPPSAAPPPPQAAPRSPRYQTHWHRSPTVYVYPRVYNNMWAWWWWTPSYYRATPPPTYTQGQGSYAPAPQVQLEPKAIHEGDYAFSVWGGTSQGLYLDGSLFSDPGIRFSMRHRVTPHLGWDASMGYYGTTMLSEEEQSDRRVDVPVQLSGTFHVFPTLPIQVYGLAGVTMDFRDFQKVAYTDGNEAFYYQDGRYQDIRFGTHFGVGAELMIAEDISIHGDARWINYSITDSRSMTQTEPVAFTANAGVSFFF